MPLLGDAWVKAYDTSEEDHYTQAGDLYRLMGESQKQQLINNILGGLRQASTAAQQRMVEYLKRADADYGSRVDQALNAG